MELAVSRWVKEAPDWFAVQRIFQRQQHRLNIIHVACILNKLASFVHTTNRRMLRTERSAFILFVSQLTAHGKQVAAGVDTITVSSLLHALAKLFVAQKVGGCQELCSKSWLLCLSQLYSAD